MGLSKRQPAGNEDHLYVVPATNLVFTPEPSVLPSFRSFYEVSVALWITPYTTSSYIIYKSTTPASRTLLEFDIRQSIDGNASSVLCQRCHYKHLAELELLDLFRQSSHENTSKKRFKFTNSYSSSELYTKYSRNSMSQLLNPLLQFIGHNLISVWMKGLITRN